MRSFIQKKPRISFYGNSAASLAIRKNYIEYVFRIDPEIYGVVNLVINSEGLTFIADCGAFFPRLREIISSVSLTRSEFPLLGSLLTSENKEYFLGSVDKKLSSFKQPQGIICNYSCSVTGDFPFTIASRRENIERAVNLLIFAQNLFLEISRCKQPKIRNLIPYFTV